MTPAVKIAGYDGTRSTYREEAARRHEPLESWESTIDLLRRCAPDEFMDCFGALLQHWRPLQEKLAGVLASPEDPWLQMQTASTSLMDEMGVVSQSFFKPLQSLLGHNAKPSAEQERARAHLWRWLESGLL